MRSFATATVFVSACLLIFLPTLLPAAQGPDSGSSSPVTRITDGGLRSGRACEVLWDLTHGPYGNYDPAGEFSQMADTLAAYGSASSTTSAGLQNIDLTPYDVLVIGTLLAWDTAYSGAEVTAVQDFITQGGAVFVMGENSGCPNSNINPVSTALGTTCGVSDPYNSVNDFAAHEIFTDVSAMNLGAPGGLTVSGTAVEIAWDYYGSPVISRVSDCEVVTVGDGNFATNDYFLDDDNKQFVLNAFFLLCGSDTPVDESSWGLIKALYR